MRFNKAFILNSFKILLLFFIAVTQYMAENSHLKNHSDSVEDEIIVKFNKNAGLSQVSGLIRKHSGASAPALSDENDYIGKLGYKKIKIPATKNPKEALAEIKNELIVKSAQINGYFDILITPDDTDYGNQWSHPKIQSPQGWDTFTGGSNITIAIVDTGVDYTHEDLSGKVIKGHDYINNDDDPMDDNKHGTHCAGIAAAISNNGKGIAGVSWGAKILAVKVLSSSGSGTWDQVANGIMYAADHGAKIISLSLGASSDSDVVHDALIYAVNKGCLIVAARGNSGNSNPSYPGSYPECMAVSATDSNDTIALFSSFGNDVSVSAPGVAVLSTIPGNLYGNLSGTSMACPHVSGLAGLIWSMDLSRTKEQIKDIIQSGVDDLGTPGKDQYFGYGRINVYKATLLSRPIIAHVPHDNEDSNSPITIKAVVTYPTVITETSLFYSLDNLSFTKVNMIADGNPDEYSGQIPKQNIGSIIYYYLKASSTICSSLKPDNAPAETFSMKVGIDVTFPVIIHTPLLSTFKNTNYMISAKVTDNLGIDAVSLFWNKNSETIYTKLDMDLSDTDKYQAEIPGQPGGTSVHYYIKAIDKAAEQNMTLLPAIGSYTFGVLIDNEYPAINHTPLQDTWKLTSPVVSAVITDNNAITSASLFWSTASLGPFTETAMTAGGGTYTASIPAYPVGTTVYYFITASDGVNLQRLPCIDTLSYNVVSAPPIVIVDNDGSDTTDDVRNYYKAALTANGYVFGEINVLEEGFPTLETLTLFKKVIWFSGSNYNSTLTSSSAAILQSYLIGGGKLFITGEDIGYESNNYGWGTSFFTNYLHAQYVQDNIGIKTLVGVAGDIIGNGLNPNISGGDGADNQSWPDEINCLDTATPVFKFTGAPINTSVSRNNVKAAGVSADGIAGLRYTNGSYGVVYFSFGFEAISTAAERSTIMKRAIDWLESADKADYTGPVITHTPLVDQVAKNMFTIKANIIDNISVKTAYLYWKTSGAYTKVTLTRKGDIFSGTIPGQAPATDIYYYITAADLSDNLTMLPLSGDYQFKVLTDVTPPTIVHKQLPDTWKLISPVVSAVVTDNVSVSSVSLYWNTTGSNPFNKITMTANSSTYTAYIPAQNSETTIYYYITATDGSNSARSPAVAGTFLSKVNQPPPILLVDNDRSDATDDCSSFFKNSLNANGYKFAEFNVLREGFPSLAILSLFEKVIWFTGKSFDTTLTSASAANLQSYLNNGGKLFITGEDIGYNIYERDWGSAFFRNYLHAEYVQDNPGIKNLSGITNDSIGNGLNPAIYGGDGANNQIWPDEIDCLDDAAPVFKYTGSPLGVNIPRNNIMPAGIAGSGAAGLRYSNGIYKVVYFSFGFEGINNANDRNALMKRVMDWLGAPNNAPLLSWTGEASLKDTGVYPIRGRSGREYSFRIKYSDANYDAPKKGYPKVHILEKGIEMTKSPYLMSKVFGNYGEGMIYEYKTTLSDLGIYSYYYEARDIGNTIATGNPVLSNAGPTLNDFIPKDLSVSNEVFADDGTSTHIEVPAGALKTDVLVEISKDPSVNDGIAYRFDMWDENVNVVTSFLKPLKITINYTITDGKVTNTNILESDAVKKLSMSYFDRVRWLTIKSTVNPVAKTVTAEPGHLSLFAAKEALSYGNEVVLSPNPFTPNGDGVNDIIGFYFDEINNDPVKIKIFNRKGRMVRTLDNVTTWDGKNDDGNLMLPGLYLWQVEIGGIVRKKATAVLAR